MEVLLGSFALIGIVVIFSFDFRYKAGFLLAIFSGFTAALFAVINSHIIHRVKAPVITFYEMAGAFISIVVFLPLYKKLWAADGALHLAPTLADWLFITILALVCTVYAYAAMINLMKKISVFFIQLTLNLEPLYGIIMAVILFGDAEKMSGKFYVGGCIILSSVIAYPLLKRKMARHF